MYTVGCCSPPPAGGSITVILEYYWSSGEGYTSHQVSETRPGS